MLTGPVKYSSKIIKASALLSDTKMLLAQWDEQADVQANLDRMLRENLFGKASRSRIAAILAIFKQRYLQDPNLLAALVVLVKGRLPAESLDRILYFQALQSDALLHDAVVDLLAGLAARGQSEISIQEVRAWIGAQVSGGKTAQPWGAETIERVAQGILATLRDFDILQGSVKKHLVLPYLPVRAFAFIAYLLHRHERSGDRLVHDPSWRIFFLSPLAAERLFLEAHQEGLLSYHAAGRVIRIDFPAGTVQEYAHVLA